MDKLAPLSSLGENRFSQASTIARGLHSAPCSTGKITSVNGPVVRGHLPRAAIGDQCVIELRDGKELRAQVVGFESDSVRIAPFDITRGLSVGCVVRSSFGPGTLKIKEDLKGCVLNCLGQVLWRIEKQPSVNERVLTLPLDRNPPDPMTRRRISNPFITGVRSIDGLCTLGLGQRVGLFAPPGVGKSTLLSMIARNAQFDTCVIGLIGERGREVREFVEDALGPEAMKRAVLVLSTSDESPMRRKLAACTATSIAEHYRDRGENVLLLVDSLTRMARASREVGLAAGELPVRKGYPSSVFTELPLLLERAGMSDRGSITGIYTVLTEDTIIDDPLAEEVKSILDGHLILSRNLAARGIYPALDPVQSVSRLMSHVRTAQSLRIAQSVRTIISRLERDRDVILFGGSPDRELEACLKLEPRLNTLLQQDPECAESLNRTDMLFSGLIRDYEKLIH